MKVAHIKSKEMYGQIKKLFYKTGVNIHPGRELEHQIRYVINNYQFKTLEEEKV
jgi:hypothetical protein